MVGFKNRYLVMEIFLDPDKTRGIKNTTVINKLDIFRAIRDSLQLNFGEHGLAASFGALQVKYVNPITKLCILRCSRAECQKVWCAITLVTSVGSCPAFFNLLDLSGSFKACRRIALEYDKAKFEQYKLVERSNVVEDNIQCVNSCFESLKNLEG